MTVIKDKIALITGASSGIGEACAMTLAREGCRVILAGRRTDRLKAVGKEISKQHHTEWLSVPLDIRNRKSVEAKLSNLPGDWQAVDILINNAGLSLGLDKLHEGLVDDWEEMIDTNVKGLLYVTRALVPGMVSRGRGDIVNIGSIAGHEVYPGGNVYCASKHAVDALTKGLRLDLVDTPLRVSAVDPGMVKTGFSRVRFKGDERRAEAVYHGLQPLTGQDIAETALFILTRPAHVQIAEIIIFPTAQASATVAHRKS
jgi:NADP-dependent 3-hydroxy acid dehydrogenase YdfG